MQDLLQLKYELPITMKIEHPIYDVFTDDTFEYFVFPIKDRESSLMERATIAHFLYQHDYHHVVYPISTKEGKWSFTHQDQQFNVCVKTIENKKRHFSHGNALAEFHLIGTSYQYEPQNVSSYGKWRSLWIEKLTGFEKLLYQTSEKDRHPFYTTVMDSLPYIIGISENAIQYIRESEQEERFAEMDQGTVTFQRYNNQLMEENIWSNELTYDHPIRDIAEFIRSSYLTKKEADVSDVLLFLEEYHTVRTLTMFSLRQLYGRLLYPIHFFDCYVKGLNGNKEEALSELYFLIENQSLYEKKVQTIFSRLENFYTSTKIEKVPWLS